VPRRGAYCAPPVRDATRVSAATVKIHVAHILMKLGVRDRVQAVMLLYASGVIRSGAP
jgi:DNA-binding NarL/FixJ family response regulator